MSRWYVEGDESRPLKLHTDVRVSQAPKLYPIRNARPSAYHQRAQCIFDFSDPPSLGRVRRPASSSPRVDLDFIRKLQTPQHSSRVEMPN